MHIQNMCCLFLAAPREIVNLAIIARKCQRSSNLCVLWKMRHSAILLREPSCPEHCSDAIALGFLHASDAPAGLVVILMGNDRPPRGARTPPIFLRVLPFLPRRLHPA